MPAPEQPSPPAQTGNPFVRQDVAEAVDDATHLDLTGIDKAYKLLSNDLKSAAQKYGTNSEDYKDFVSELTQQLQQKGSLNDLSLAWAAENMPKYQFNPNAGYFSDRDMSLAKLMAQDDPFASAMLNGLSNQFDAIKKSYPEYIREPTFGLQQSVDGITPMALSQFIRNRDKQLIEPT